jgi:membrane fusion protein, multidrug efflux system
MNMHAPISVSEQEGAEPRPRLSRGWRRLGLGLVPLAALAGAYQLVTRETPVAAAPPMPTVTVARPLVREVAEWDQYIGRFAAARSVEVRPRVSGAVTAVLFRDGALVRAGQPLFRIDPRPFAAALAEARAGLASARSDLALAQTNLARARRLSGEDGIAQSEVDQLAARVQAAAAAVAAGQARVRARALDVEFTLVRAPIAGRISDRRVDAGNLIAAGEGAGGTLLTTINTLDPIYFEFTGSEALFLKARRAAAVGATASPVEVRLQDEPDYRWRGRLDFTDNQLDQRSGTIRGRAVLANPGLFLTPGLFGQMRLSSGGRSRALLVPDTAIQTDQARKVLLAVGPDGTVSARPVELGPVIDGLRVVRSGLRPDDRVVISGTQMAMPGSKAQTRPGRIEAVRQRLAEPAAPPIIGEATFAAR